MGETVKPVKMDQEYYEAVEYLATIQSEDSFGNSDENHALSVFVVLFKKAKNKVRIFAHNLCSNVPNSNEYINELKDFLENRNGEVEILLEEKPDDKSLKENPVFEMLRSVKSNKWKIKQTNARAKYGEYEINFSTVGDNMYRIEYEKDKRTARCCFNNRKITEKLNILFDKFFTIANPISLTC